MKVELLTAFYPFVGDAVERQRLLEQAEEGRRLRMLIRFLTRELDG